MLSALGIAHGDLELLDGWVDEHHLLVGDAQVVVGVVVVDLDLLFHAFAEGAEQLVHTLDLFHHVGGVVHLLAFPTVHEGRAQHVREVEEGIGEIAFVQGEGLDGLPQFLQGGFRAFESGCQLGIPRELLESSLDLDLGLLGAAVVELEVDITEQGFEFLGARPNGQGRCLNRGGGRGLHVGERGQSLDDLRRQLLCGHGRQRHGRG
jgi:hypothetical protein